MSLPSIIQRGELMNVWFNATNQLIEHVGNTSVYVQLDTTATGNVNVAGTIRTQTLTVDGAVNALSTMGVSGAVNALSTMGVSDILTVTAAARSANGTAAAPAWSYIADTASGWYLPAAATLGVSTGGTERVRVTNTAMQPTTTGGVTLGTTTAGWGSLFLQAGQAINMGSGDVTITHSANTLTFAGATTRYQFNDGYVAVAGDGTVSGGELRVAGKSSFTNFYDQTYLFHRMYARNVGGTGLLYTTTGAPTSYIYMGLDGQIEFNLTSGGTADTVVSGGSIRTALRILNSANVVVLGATTISNTFSVSGAVNALSTLGVTGNLTASIIKDNTDDVRAIPIVGKTATYQLASSDIGRALSTNSSITVNGAVLVTNNVFTIYNNSAASITITQGSGATMYLAGTANTGNRTLAERGLCTLLCVAANTFVISGAGLS